MTIFLQHGMRITGLSSSILNIILVWEDRVNEVEGPSVGSSSIIALLTLHKTGAVPDSSLVNLRVMQSLEGFCVVRWRT